MKRSDFIKSAGIGLGGAALTALVSPITNKGSAKCKNAPKVIRDGEGRKLNVIGDKMTIKLSGEDTDGQYVLAEQYNEPGVGIPMHVHEHEDEIFRVLEGELEVVVDGNRSVLGPGDTAFCPRGIPHTWRVVGNSWAKVDLSFFPAGLEKMFHELAALPEGPPDMAVIAEICGRYGVRFVG
jgi:quercetin dioxygenase-like cupin family protein